MALHNVKLYSALTEYFRDETQLRRETKLPPDLLKIWATDVKRVLTQANKDTNQYLRGVHFVENMVNGHTMFHMGDEKEVPIKIATAMGAVQKHPDRFDRLAICDTPGQATPASAQQWNARITNAQAHGMQAEVEPTISRWFPPETVKANPPHLDVLRQMILATPVNGFAGCAAALADHDYRPGMKNVKNRVLYMCGEKDGGNTAVMRTMKQEFPAAQYVELADAGHISNMDRPAEFSRALRESLTA